MRTLEKALADRMKEPGFRDEYEALEPDFTIVQAMINARRKSGLTQQKLAERSGIAQGDISKIERGEANPSLKTLKRLATAMDMKLVLEFEPMDANALTA